MKKLIINGLASRTVFREVPINEDDLNLDCLKYLRKNNVPIASACFGEGVCKKCLVDCYGNEVFACKITISEIICIAEEKGNSPIISISYL